MKKTLKISLGSASQVFTGNLVQNVIDVVSSDKKNNYEEFIDTNSNNVVSPSTLEKPSSKAKTIKELLLQVQAPQYNTFYLKTFNTLHPSKKLTKLASSDEEIISKYDAEPYESLSGITKTRPEILFLMDFLPVYAKNKQLSTVGKFLDTQIQARNLKAENILQTINSVSNFGAARSIFRKNLDLFETELNELEEKSNLLLNLAKMIELSKKQLDLRDKIYNIDYRQVITNIRSLSTQNSVSYFYFQRILDTSRKYIPFNFDVIDYFVSLGYNKDAVTNIWFSSKIWMQLTKDLKNLIQYQSPVFLNSKENNKDNTSSSIVEHKKIGLSIDDHKDLGFLEEITSFNISDFTKTRKAISNTFLSFNNDLKSIKNENRIAALILLINKEYRFSRGLSSDKTKQILSDYFKYQVDPNSNLTVFDNVLGKFVKTISDIPKVETNSLSSLAQSSIENNAEVLTFEQDYIQNDTNIMTPGAVYYIDEIFNISNDQKFSTSKIKNLVKSFSKAQSNFSSLSQEMNLFCSSAADGLNSNNFISVIEHPASFVSKLLDNLVDNKGHILEKFENDKLLAIISQSSNDLTIKSLLFMLVMTIISRQYTTGNDLQSVHTARDNTNISTQAVEEILNQLENSIKKVNILTLYSKQHNIQLVKDGNIIVTDDSLGFNQVKAALLSGTGSPLIKFIIDSMKDIYAELKIENVISSKTSRSLYSGHKDTILMMIFFDIFVSLISEISHKKITGITQQNSNSKNPSFNIIISEEKNLSKKNFINTLVSKLEAEVSLMQQGLFTVIGILDSFVGKYKKLAENLDNFDLKKVELSPSNLKYVMNIQQIYLINSNIQDLISKFRQTSSYNKNLENEVQILDFVQISKNLKSTLEYYFNSPEFIGNPAANKQIISVGIPLGFSKKLQSKQFSNKKTVTNRKQEDVITVSIWKTDTLQPDIIYKPLKFLFELSRFPVRDDSHYTETTSDKNIFSSIPTRDFEQSFLNQNDSNIFTWNIDNIKENGLQQAFDSEQYDFLTIEQKNEIIKNTISSFLIENYVNLLTGISLADYKFDLDILDKDNASYIVQDLIIEMAKQHLANINQQNLSNNNSKSTIFQKEVQDKVVTKNQINNKNIDTLSNEISDKSVFAIDHIMDNINSAKRIKTSISSVKNFSKTMFQPKQFDRVFNLIIDPDDFEIDIIRTNSTKHGKKIIDNLILSGDIIISALNNNLPLVKLGSKNGNINSNFARTLPQLFKFKQKNKNEGDQSLNKYFVTLESFGENDI